MPVQAHRVRPWWVSIILPSKANRFTDFNQVRSLEARIPSDMLYGKPFLKFRCSAQNFISRVVEQLRPLTENLLGAYPLSRSLARWAKNMGSALGHEAGAKRRGSRRLLRYDNKEAPSVFGGHCRFVIGQRRAEAGSKACSPAGLWPLLATTARSILETRQRPLPR
jgi:hypothetical protein